MPIYEYQCQACGHQTEILQKVSDKPLTKCSECGRQKMRRLVSAPAFQLKGEGWYVTDFRDKNKKTQKSEATEKGDSPGAKVETSKVDSGEKVPKDAATKPAKKVDKKDER